MLDPDPELRFINADPKPLYLDNFLFRGDNHRSSMARHYDQGKRNLAELEFQGSELNKIPFVFCNK